jgi:hypothetical protein
MKHFSLRYSLLTYRLDQLWFPLCIWALFVIIALFLPDKLQIMARGYLGFVVPLMGGIMAAYSILDDPVLELRFATPVQSSQTLIERMGIILAVQAICALSFQIFCTVLGEDLAMFGTWCGVQMAWLVPTLALMALGVTASLLATQAVGGALLVGVLWLMELIMRGWFAENEIARYFLVFMRAAILNHPSMVANEISVTVLAGLLFITSWAILQRQERYI